MRFNAVATCIGSFPHTEPGPLCDFLLTKLPDCPTWPQLPARSYRESMYAQYAAALPGALIDEERGRTTLALPEDASEVLTDFFSAAMAEDAAPFAPRPEDAAGYHSFVERLGLTGSRGLWEGALARAPGGESAGLFIKGHVTGPVSFGLTVTRPDGRAVFFDDTLREVVISGLAAQARAQVQALGRTGRPVILFLDEPFLASYGSATVPLSEADVVESLTLVTDAVLAAGGIPGVHCCGNTDWSLLFRTSAQVVSFDAFCYLDSMTLYPEALGGFLERGGALAWGVVPTEPSLLEGEDSQSILSRLRQGMGRVAASGVSAAALRASCLVTPSCGMGTLSIPMAERIVELTALVAAGLRES